MQTSKHGIFNPLLIVLAVLLCAAAAAGLSADAHAAGEGSAASVSLNGGAAQNYASLADAYAAIEADGVTEASLTLLRDAEAGGATLTVNARDVSFDLNGHALDGGYADSSAPGPGFAVVENGAEFHFLDSSKTADSPGTGVISGFCVAMDSKSCTGAITVSDSTLILEDICYRGACGTFIAFGNGAPAITMNGCRFIDFSDGRILSDENSDVGTKSTVLINDLTVDGMKSGGSRLFVGNAA